ncbi:MAG: ArsB/NhaD family transporter [Candidatus Bipolaricaulota bacterium]
MDWLTLLIASGIFVVTYTLIFSGRVHRTEAALAGAVAMMVVGTLMGFFPVDEALEHVDVDTMWLLFGMMAIVGLLRRTGFFQFVAVGAAKLARGKPWVLLLSLGTAGAVLSMFLDNLTTVITLAPVTLSIAELLGVPALPFLLATVLSANTGGVATLVGDPPNMIIGSSAGFGFNDFLTRSAPISLALLFSTLGFLLFRFRRELGVTTRNVETLVAMDPRAALADKRRTGELLGVLGLVVLLFVTHQYLGLSPGLVALVGAAVAGLVLRPTVHEFLEGVEWEMLIFLAGLFIVVGGLEASGAFALLAQSVNALAAHPVALAVVLLWLGCLLCWSISAIPATIILIAIVRGLGTLGVPMGPLWWALVWGIGFGANGTPLGTAANMAILSVAERDGKPIAVRAWLAAGMPVALLGCAVGSVVLWLGWSWLL